MFLLEYHVLKKMKKRNKKGLQKVAKCEICEKAIRTGHRISVTRSQISRRANRMWKPNIKRIKIVQNGTAKTVNICTRCLRSNKVTRA